MGEGRGAWEMEARGGKREVVKLEIASTGIGVDLVTAHCPSSGCPSYCQGESRSSTLFDWKLLDRENPQIRLGFTKVPSTISQGS